MNVDPKVAAAVVCICCVCSLSSIAWGVQRIISPESQTPSSRRQQPASLSPPPQQLPATRSVKSTTKSTSRIPKGTMIVNTPPPYPVSLPLPPTQAWYLGWPGDSTPPSIVPPGDGGNTPLPSPKHTWPELIGMTVDEARHVVQQECPECGIEVRNEGGMMTLEYVHTRIRIFVDKDASNRVVRVVRG
jgi:hypothetical protein